MSRSVRLTPRGWLPLTILAMVIALYALSFYFRGSSAFPPNLAESFAARPWGIYTHVLFGALALLVGPFQFRRGILAKRRALHRNLGRIYVGAAFMTGLGGIYLAMYSLGGLATHLGFGVLGALVMATTARAYERIRALDVQRHREWMVRSFALIFAAVTLRIELPLLIMLNDGAFVPAYVTVSWLCWMPNLMWAEWYVRRSRAGTQLPRHSRATTVTTTTGN